MFARRTLIALVACVSALALTAAFAQAAKTPSYHVYKKCKSKYSCSAAVYLNSKQTRVVVAQTGRLCNDGSWASIDFTGSAKVSSKGKFGVEVDVRNFDVTAQATIAGKGKIKGKVKKKNKITLEYSIDNAPTACGKVSGTVTAKYKGTQTGG